MINVLFVANDNLIRISDVKNESTGISIDDAVVTATLTTIENAEVAGQSWPLTLTAMGNGLYEGTIESIVAILDDAFFILVWDIVKGGLVAHGETIIPASTRR